MVDSRIVQMHLVQIKLTIFNLLYQFRLFSTVLLQRVRQEHFAIVFQHLVDLQDCGQPFFFLFQFG